MKIVVPRPRNPIGPPAEMESPVNPRERLEAKASVNRETRRSQRSGLPRRVTKETTPARALPYSAPKPPVMTSSSSMEVGDSSMAAPWVEASSWFFTAMPSTT